MRWFLLAAILTGALQGAAAAESPEQLWAWCRGHDPKRLMHACSALIRAGPETPDLARAFVNRGRALFDTAQYDNAIRDFDSAIHFDPNYPEAFNGRALAYAGKGLSDRALQDFDQAVQLDQNYAIAWFNRGILLRFLGRESDAAQSFVKAKESGPRLVPPKE
jgi:tetratricopeptide (TPR) repeat protein